MAGKKHTTNTRMPRAVRGEVLEPPPPMPEETSEERAFSLEICRRLDALSGRLQQRNLQNAVALAQQAACGHGPLVDHFAELGRRYGHTLREPVRRRGELKIVDGGRGA